MTASQSPTRRLSTGLLATGLLGLGLFVAQPGHADVTAAFDSVEGEMTIEYRDDDHVRMRTADNAFFVIREGKGYLVNREDGEWFVIAVDDMIEMMAAAGARPEAVIDDEPDFELRDTGRTETVAGIEGRVYEYAERDSWTGDLGPATEIVLSDDPDVRAVYRGIQRTTGILMVMADSDMEAPSSTPDIGDAGLLRYGDEWRLTRIDRGAIPDRHFALPAEPRRLPGMAGAPPGAGVGAGAGHGPHGDSDPGWLEKEARDIGRTAADEARDETRRGVSGEVREGVRDGVRGLFGR